MSEMCFTLVLLTAVFLFRADADCIGLGSYCFKDADCCSGKCPKGLCLPSPCSMPGESCGLACCDRGKCILDQHAKAICPPASDCGGPGYDKDDEACCYWLRRNSRDVCEFQETGYTWSVTLVSVQACSVQPDETQDCPVEIAWNGTLGQCSNSQWIILVNNSDSGWDGPYVSPEDRDATVTGLLPESWFTITVRAYCPDDPYLSGVPVPLTVRTALRAPIPDSPAPWWLTPWLALAVIVGVIALLVVLCLFVKAWRCCRRVGVLPDDSDTPMCRECMFAEIDDVSIGHETMCRFVNELLSQFPRDPSVTEFADKLRPNSQVETIKIKLSVKNWINGLSQKTDQAIVARWKKARGKVTLDCHQQRHCRCVGDDAAALTQPLLPGYQAEDSAVGENRPARLAGTPFQLQPADEP